MTTEPLELAGLAAAALGGAAVGLERQWSGHADGPSGRFAGLRTFTLLGGLAGLSGLLWRHGLAAAAVVLLATAGAVIVAAYAAASRRDVDATTEVAAVVVLAAGVLSGLGVLRLSSAVFALTTLVLVEKSRLHAAVARLDDVSLRAAVRFAVLSIVVLPLLPEGPLGWLGLRPRNVWVLVLFLSGLSFAGYVARRLVGRERGYALTGMLGGIVSSTSITLAFSRLSRVEPSASAALAAGAIAAKAVLFPRVLLTVAVLDPALALSLWPRLALPFLAAAAAAAVFLRSPAPGTSADDVTFRNPLQLGAALKMAATFQVVLLLMEWVGRRFGDAGMMPMAAALGAADIDALTISLASGGRAIASPDTAARAITVGVLASTVVKTGIALVWGSPRFRVLAGGTLLGLAAILTADLLLRG